MTIGAHPCDWDHESFCVVEGCRAPAVHRRLDSMTDDGVPVVLMVCCEHARED